MFAYAGLGFGIARAQSEGLNGSSGSKLHPTAGEAAIDAQLEIADLSGWRHSVRDFGAFSAEVVAAARRHFLRLFAAFFVSAGALLVPAHSAAAAAEITDVTSRAGLQLKEQFYKLASVEDVRVALDFFAKLNLYPDVAGAVEISFRADGEYRDLFFIPFEEPAGAGPKHLILVAMTSKKMRVLLGTISTEVGKSPEVTEESLVVDRAVQPAQEPHLKNFFKCSVVGCVPAGVGCIAGGAAWLPCFCLWCGGSVVACGVLEVFWP